MACHTPGRGRPGGSAAFETGVFVIPIERLATSLRPGAPIAVSSAPVAIEVAGWMQANCAGVLAVAWAGDGPLVLARYGETGGEGDELK